MSTFLLLFCTIYSLCISFFCTFCTFFHIAKSIPICYLIVRKGDTNVLRNPERQALQLRKCSDEKGYSLRVDEEIGCIVFWNGFRCGLKEALSNLQKERLTKDVRYQDSTEVALNRENQESVKGYFYVMLKGDRLRTVPFFTN